MNKKILLAGREVEYNLTRKNVKNINLRIRSDCSVSVSANDKITMNIIEGFLQNKARYILSAIDKYSEIQKYAMSNYTYNTGESFRFLGKNLRLKVVNGKNSVVSDGLYLILSVKDKEDVFTKKKLIFKWYDEQCKEVFIEIINEFYPIFRKYGIAFPGLVLRNMISRWGSCQPKRGIIALNKRLVETPRNAIQYVIMHEYVHFLFNNHSKNFYEVLSTLMPDWKERKKLLETAAFYIVE